MEIEDIDKDALDNLLNKISCEIEITVKYEHIIYRFLLFGKALFILPVKLGEWLFFRNSKFVVQKLIGCTIIDEKASNCKTK